MEEEQKKPKERRDDWYFKDWKRVRTLDERGKKHTSWIYQGKYYDLPETAPRGKLRKLAVGSAVVETIVYLLISFSPARGAVANYVGIESFFGIIPLIYYCIGAVQFARLPGRMTFRDLHASLKRMNGASWGGVILMGLTVIGQLIYIFLHLQASTMVWEVLYLLGAVVCAAIYGAFLRLVDRYPVTEVP